MGAAEPDRQRDFRRQATTIQPIFQDPAQSLSPRRRIGQSMDEVAGCLGEPRDEMRARLAKILQRLGLPPGVVDQYPHQISGGQARRAAIARALLFRPRILAADEPTAGLDVSVQGEVLNLLNDLRERLGLAMVIITHNLHVVHHIADRMAVMYLGRFVEAGPTEQIFSAPSHPYTAALLSANPEPDPDKARDRISLPAEVPSLLARPSGCEFHTRCPWAQERCRHEAPAPREFRGARVACHFPLEPGAKPPS